MSSKPAISRDLRLQWLVGSILGILSVCLIPSVIAVTQSQNPVMFKFIEAFGGDFLTFYTADYMVEQGQTTQLYDHDLSHQQQTTIEPRADAHRPWFYPPNTLLLIAPFAHSALGFATSYLLWGLGGLVAMVVAHRYGRLSGLWLAILLASFTGLVTLLSGQMSFFIVAAFLVGMVALMRNRQILAGMMIGLMTVKPTLGVLIPFVLIAGGYWRAFGVAVVTTVWLLAISVVWPGVGAWQGFVMSVADTFVHMGGDVSQGTRMGMETAKSLAPLSMFNPYGLFKTHDMPTIWAWALQIVISLGVLALVCHRWIQMGATPTTAAMTLSGTALAAPYFMHYEIVILIPAVLLLVAHRDRHHHNAALWLGVLLVGLAAHIHFFAFHLQTQVVWLVSLYVFVLALRTCALAPSAKPAKVTS